MAKRRHPLLAGPVALLLAVLIVGGGGLAAVRFAGGEARGSGPALPVDPGRADGVSTRAEANADRAAAAAAIRTVEQAWEGGDAVHADRVLRETMVDLVTAAGGIDAAQRWIDGTLPGEKRTNLRRAFEFAWAGLDPDAARAWAARLPDADERSEALTRVLGSEAASDPRKALEDTARAEVDDRAALTDEFVQRWASQDLSAAQRWALAEPAGEGRDRHVARIAFVQAQSFPEDAARFALQTLPPGPALDEAVISIVHQWSLRDPANAGAWVENFPAGGLRERARNELNGLQTKTD